VGEIIWQKRKGGGNDSRYMAIDHEIIFIFCKDISTQEKKWRIPYDEEYLKRYREKDENGRFYWDTLHRGGLQSPIIYDVVCPDGSIIKNGTWQVSEKSFKEKQALGQIRIIPSREGGKWTVQHKVYQPEGRVFRSIFADVSNTDSANEIKNLFGVNKFFDNPKPIGLITQLINMCNVEKEDVIFDFFAGSATSAHALINLNIDDNTSRKYIMVQLPELCDEKSEAFKSGYKTIAEIGKERIRRAAAKIKEDNPEYEGDLGFKVFKLDSTNIKPWEVDFDMTERTLEDFISNIKTDRREEDVLYEVLLKYGLDLTLPITERTIAGKKVFDIGMGALIICLADSISLEVVEGIAKLKDELNPEIMRVVFKDSGFKDDVVKTNAVQILKQAGIIDVRSL
jgi:adenine-specific DNA-methyltransferase